MTRETSGDARSVRNERLAEGLAMWGRQKDRRTLSEVLRRAVIGQLLLDITDSEFADPAAGFQAGDRMAIASQTDNAGKRLLLAFTDSREITLYRGRPGISLVQPAAAVLAQAARDFEGVAIDPRSENACIVYADEIRQNLADDPEAVGRLAEVIVERSLPFPAFLAELARTPVFVPFTAERDEAGKETGAALVMSLTGPDGSSYAVAGTSPAELWAWAPEAGAQRTSLARVAGSVLRNGLPGAYVNPAGPPVFVPAEALRPFAEQS